MHTEMGELIAGAYLKVIVGCDVVSYNVRPKGGGLEGLGELDVVGLHFETNTAYLCECTTHIQGMLYGKGSKDTIEKLKKKAERQIKYAETHLKNFDPRYMFWSPIVSPAVEKRLKEAVAGQEDETLRMELIINMTYTEKITQLRTAARTRANDENNEAFRLLQILERLK